jgi:hypothetical protein
MNARSTKARDACEATIKAVDMKTDSPTHDSLLK